MYLIQEQWKNNFDSNEWTDEEQLFLGVLRGWPDSIDRLGGSVEMVNSDQQ